MIVSTREFPTLYECIKLEYQQSEEKKLLIFASKTDVDSVCALRILLGVLDCEGLHYSVYPVSNYEEIKEITMQELQGAEEHKNVIMINCGATEDVMGIMGDADWADLCRITIIDSRRPIYHKHNQPSRTDNVMILLDDNDPFPHSMVPEAESIFDPDADEDAEDGDDDQDDERPTRRRRLNEEDDMDPEQRRVIQEQRLVRGEQLRTHYQNNGYGKPSSMLMLELAHQLNFHNALYCWCAILGLTEHLMTMRVSKEDYATWHSALVGYVEVTETHPRNEEHVVDGETTVKKPQGSAKVKVTEDFWLPMLRHWTVFDAMMFSPYVGIKMETYLDSGVDSLSLLLAKMGIPLNASKKTWLGFAPQFKRTFKKRLIEHAGDSNLSVQDMAFDSFQLIHGHDLQITATDAVYAASGLLTHDDTEHRRFWHAYKSLDVEKGAAVLRKGLEMAKFLQRRIIMDTGMAVVRSKLTTRKTALFSFLNLSEIDGLNADFFAHPIPLLRVAMFIQQYIQHKQMRTKPVVVVSPPVPHSSKDGGERQGEVCLVLGLAERPADPSKPVVNPFGQFFAMAYEKLEKKDMGVQYGFDATVIELMKEDIEHFHEELKYTMLEARNAS